MSSEYAEIRVVRNFRRDERARREAWEEARKLQVRQQALQERIDEARREYGSAVLGTRAGPTTPRDGCDRAEVERYVRELRRYCAVTERELSHGLVAAKRAIARAKEEIARLQAKRRSQQECIDRIVERAGEGATPAFDAPPVEPRQGCAHAAVETYVRDLRKHCAAVEKQINRSERNQRREEKAWDRARERARGLHRRVQGVQDRIAEVGKRYGDDVVAGLSAPPVQPGEPCERSTFEEYVGELRAHCAVVERQVTQAEAVAARARKDAWRRAGSLEERWGSLRERISGTAAVGREGDRAVPRRPAESCSLAGIQDYVRKMQAHCDAVEKQARLENADVVRRATEQAFIGLEAWRSEPTSLDDIARRHEGGAGGVVAPEGDASDPDEAAREEAMDVLELLSPSVPAEEAAELERFVEAAVGQQDGSAEELLETVRAGVRSANVRAVRRERDAETAVSLRHRLLRVEASVAASVVEELIAVETGKEPLVDSLVTRVEEIERRFSTGVQEAIDQAARNLARAAELKARLRGLDGKEVVEVRGEIESVELKNEMLDPALERRVEDVGREARARADQSYVAMVMREELEKLGYRAEEGFDSLLVREGKAIVRSVAGDYGLAFEFERDSDRLRMEPVRIANPDAAAPRAGQMDDGTTEAACCRDLERVRAGMAERKIESDVLARENRAHSGQALRVVPGAQGGPPPVRPAAIQDQRRRARRRPNSRGVAHECDRGPGSGTGFRCRHVAGGAMAPLGGRIQPPDCRAPAVRDLGEHPRHLPDAHRRHDFVPAAGGLPVREAETARLRVSVHLRSC